VTSDVLIVGAGAAGLATAIFTRAGNAQRSVLLLDGARTVGAKILVSGGSRCNVTNTIVTERDYWGGPPGIIRRVLRAFPASEAAAFFRRAGVPLHEEEDGKLFPDSNRSRDVLEALLRQMQAAGAVLRESRRVVSITPQREVFAVDAGGELLHARAVVLATGGQSLPKSGSDGTGYALARSLGHTVVPTTPALAPLVLDGGAQAMHARLSGVSVYTHLTLWVGGAVRIRLSGPLLWTHFGISGPVALNMSRHWLRAHLEKGEPALTASFMPRNFDFDRTDGFLLDQTRAHPRHSIAAVIGRIVPGAMCDPLLARAGVDPAARLAALERENRRAVARALVELPIPVKDSRGYNYAEATAGGVDLREIVPATMESRMCPGLYLVGEILDVDGRLGGFNFQWAWSSGFAAGRALSRR
jgi:predicted Rossmann fold flavoprotein